MICAVLAHAAFSPSIRVTDGLAPAALAASTGGATVVSELISDRLTSQRRRGHHPLGHDARPDAPAAGGREAARRRARGRWRRQHRPRSRAAAGLWVLNTPGASTASVVELTLAHAASTRQLTTADRGLREGRWLKGELAGFELGGKRLGLLGFGRIAQGAARATALGMEVDAHCRAPTPPWPPRWACGCTLRRRALRRVHARACTARSPSAPPPSSTPPCSRGCAGGTASPCGAHLVNNGGGIVVEADAAAALASGTLPATPPTS